MTEEVETKIRRIMKKRITLPEIYRELNENNINAVNISMDNLSDFIMGCFNR